MKKIIAILLAAIMLLSFVACSGNGGGQTAQTTLEPTEAPTAVPTEEPKPTKEQLLSEAVELASTSYDYDRKENPVRAKAEYEGKAYTIVGYVKSFGNDHVVICVTLPRGGISHFVDFRVFLPQEEIMLLKKDQMIEVVGILESSYVTQQGPYGATYETEELELRDAFLVKDVL